MEFDYKAAVDAYMKWHKIDFTEYVAIAETQYENVESCWMDDTVDIPVQEIIPAREDKAEEFCRWFKVPYTKGAYDDLKYALADWLNEHKLRDMDGEFSLDGDEFEPNDSLRIIYSLPKRTLKFDEWRRDNDYPSRDEFLCASEDSEEETDEEWDRIVEQYQDFCDARNYWSEDDM